MECLLGGASAAGSRMWMVTQICIEQVLEARELGTCVLIREGQGREATGNIGTAGLETVLIQHLNL